DSSDVHALDTSQASNRIAPERTFKSHVDRNKTQADRRSIQHPSRKSIDPPSKSQVDRSTIQIASRSIHHPNRKSIDPPSKSQVDRSTIQIASRSIHPIHRVSSLQYSLNFSLLLQFINR